MSRMASIRRRYDNDGKSLARRVVMEAAIDHKVESVLDLYGSGESARAFREAVPDAAITSCESDVELFAALRLDGQQNGFAYHLGDFRKAKGRYDLIWLDLTSQWCRAAQVAVEAAAKMLTGPRVLAVTLMAARESPEIAADRLYAVPNGIERASGLRVKLLFPYQSGSPMWLLVLLPGSWSLFHDAVMPMTYVRGKSVHVADWERVFTTQTVFQYTTAWIAEHGWLGDYCVSGDLEDEVNAYCEARRNKGEAAA